MLRQYFNNTEEESMKSEHNRKKEQMTKRRQTDDESEEDVKQRLTEMRNKGGSGEPRRYDNRFTIEPNQFPYLTSSIPADD